MLRSLSSVPKYSSDRRYEDSGTEYRVYYKLPGLEFN